MNRTHPAYQFQYAMRAGDWKDPATYEWGAAVKESNIFPSLVGPNDFANCGIEDPDLWLDRRGVLHAVVHNWRAGGHAASTDRGRTWEWFGGNCSSAAGSGSVDWSRSVWPQTLAFRSGPAVTPHRRERPHVVVHDGRVVALTNGLQTTPPPKDHSWTLVVPTRG